MTPLPILLYQCKSMTTPRTQIVSARQRGGSATRGGEGEKQLELEGRRLQEREGVLRAQLERIKRTREQQRRGRSKVTTVALVGYTSAGTSSIDTHHTQHITPLYPSYAPCTAGKSSLHARLTKQRGQQGERVGQTSLALARGEDAEYERGEQVLVDDELFTTLSTSYSRARYCNGLGCTPGYIIVRAASP
jgi:50S ribosomal subunit-associated GTPase HflX